jgi:3-keto-disaccharide hydrolase
MKYELFFNLLVALLPALALAQTINFDDDETGKPPKGFSAALTGRGKVGNWVVMKDEAAPSKPNVLAQTDMDATGYRFPVCVFDGLSAKDVEVSVKFKPLKGSDDQAGGIVWRYSDKDNYYILRANALENNVVLYKIEKGKRTDLPLKGVGRTYGKQAKVLSGQWSTLRVVAKGKLFTVYYNGEKLYEVEDNTFTGAGKIGLWTKADSYTLFDDFTIISLKQ